ncbi:hypothetical protein [Cryptosporangium sp. NPDC048952]|uniref:hypothetical protein n=1 Tax=Cryptosporangium sp. NPDC048952 TaxID=3363961 RepID=UPI003716FDEA
MQAPSERSRRVVPVAPARPDAGARWSWVVTAVVGAMWLAPDADQLAPGLGAKVVGLAAVAAAVITTRR